MLKAAKHRSTQTTHKSSNPIHSTQIHPTKRHTRSRKPSAAPHQNHHRHPLSAHTRSISTATTSPTQSTLHRQPQQTSTPTAPRGGRYGTKSKSTHPQTQTFSTSTNPLHKPRAITVNNVYMNPRLEPEPYTFARRMMTYWFQDYERGKIVNDECRKKWFVGHPVLDKYMVYEFGADYEAYKMEKLSGNPGPYTEIERHPLGALSLIILIQQYPKASLRLAKAENGGFLTPELVVNSHFGPTARLAHETFLEMVYNSIQLLHPLRFDVIERIFFFMPLLQAENRTSQKIATARFSDLVEEAPRMHKPLLTAVKEFALAHVDVIQQFGRFPQRNELMGRESTPDEKEYLRLHTSDWEPIKIYNFVKDGVIEGLGQEQLQGGTESTRTAVQNELPVPMRNPNAWAS